MKKLFLTGAASNPSADLLSFYPTQTPDKAYDIVLHGSGIEIILLAYVLSRHFGQKKIAVVSSKEFYEPDGDELLIPLSLPLAGADLFKLSLALLKDFNKHFPAVAKPVRQQSLHLITSDAHMRSAVDQSNILEVLGMQGWIITPRETHLHAPLLALHPETQGALFFPNAFCINRQTLYFSCLKAAQALGVTFLSDCSIIRIHIENAHIRGLETSRGTLAAQHFVSDTQLPALNDHPVANNRVCKTYQCREWRALPIRAPFKPSVFSYHDQLHILYNSRGIFTFRDFEPVVTLDSTASKILKLLPDLAQQNIHTQHIHETTFAPDKLPVIGTTPVQGLYFMDGLGWNRYCYAFGAAVALASTITTRSLHPTLHPFNV